MMWRAGLSLAMLCGAAPAEAQLSFFKCNYTWSYTETGGYAMGPLEEYYGVEGQSLYTWTPDYGLVSACDRGSRLWFGPSTICKVKITDSVISAESDVGADVAFWVSVNRLNGNYSSNYGTMTGTGTCARVADPRTSPRAI